MCPHVLVIQFPVRALIETSSCVFMTRLLKCLQADTRHLRVRKGAGGESGCLLGDTGLADGGRKPGAASKGVWAMRAPEGMASAGQRTFVNPLPGCRVERSGQHGSWERLLLWTEVRGEEQGVARGRVRAARAGISLGVGFANGSDVGSEERQMTQGCSPGLLRPN